MDKTKNPITQEYTYVVINCDTLEYKKIPIPYVDKETNSIWADPYSEPTLNEGEQE